MNQQQLNQQQMLEALEQKEQKVQDATIYLGIEERKGKYLTQGEIEELEEIAKDKRIKVLAAKERYLTRPVLSLIQDCYNEEGLKGIKRFIINSRINDPELINDINRILVDDNYALRFLKFAYNSWLNSIDGCFSTSRKKQKYTGWKPKELTEKDKEKMETIAGVIYCFVEYNKTNK